MKIKSEQFFRNHFFKFFAAIIIVIIILYVSISVNPTSVYSKEDYPSNDVKDHNDAEPNSPPRPSHDHEAFKQQQKQRKKMIKFQIKRRDIKDPNVLYAMEIVPRHAFVRKQDSGRAYSDRPLPIGYGQTISQPYIVGYMTEKLELKPDFRVLEIGTGSGYQAAVCAEIAREVYTIEIVEKLAESARQRLKRLGYGNIYVKHGDGYYGWEKKAPFDVIIITAAAGLVPPPLIEQLKPGGSMILPLGSPYGFQTLVLIEKDKKGNISSRQLLPVRFVPMVGKTMK